MEHLEENNFKMQVTDIKRIVNKGTTNQKEITGFYMDGYLKENMDSIPKFIKNDWDCVGIVSGHGKVRIGKSTIAAQVGYYIAWMLAGGQTITEREGNKYIFKKNVAPTNPVRFNLKENYVYNPDDLMDAAEKLYNKYGKNQVIIYDEGRQGLDSSRAMETINKGMEDFFQECGVYNHIILIVLPNFFKLHEDYAVSRSFFLIDCFHDEQYRKGYFNFYNERQKEYLYFFGKKKIGISARYNATNPSFWGKYTKWLPFNKEEYNRLKMEALKKKKINRRDKSWKLQRDVLMYAMNKSLNVKYDNIKDYLERFGDLKVSSDMIMEAIKRTKDRLSKE